MPRKVARVLVSNQRAELLLLRYDADYAVSSERSDLRHYWVPPGGGLAEGESFEEAALRELFEETGICLESIVHHVWDRVTRFVSRGALVEQHEKYFFATEAVTSNRVHTSGTDELIAGYCWWPMPEMLASDEVFFPNGLPELFGRLLGRGLPAEPLRLGD